MIDGAEVAYRAADVFLSEFLQKDPGNVSYRDERAELLGHLGKLLYMRGGQRGLPALQAAGSPLRQALAIDDVSMAEYPHSGDCERRFAQNSLYLSGMLFVANRPAERDQVLGRAGEILRRLRFDSPAECVDIAVLHKLFGDLMHATDRKEEGAGAYDRSLALLESVAKAPLADAISRESIVGLFHKLGQHSFCRSNQPEKEMGYYARMLPIWDRLVAGMNLTPAELCLQADAHRYVGYVFMRQNEEEEAATALRARCSSTTTCFAAPVGRQLPKALADTSEKLRACSSQCSDRTRRGRTSSGRSSCARTLTGPGPTIYGLDDLPKLVAGAGA